jgi:TonB family protein
MKTLFSICIGILFAFAIFLPCVSAQDTKDAAPKIINGGVLNGKAMSLPKPEYPAIARDAGVGGVVSVNIVIDESGLVVSAEADLNDQRFRKSEDGSVPEPLPVDPSLREAAENAARLARFSPTFLSGQPVKIKGTIVYNFVPGKDVTTETPRTVAGGVLNGKALSLAKPEYPAAAKAVKAEGAVSVQIMIDEEGNVVSATAVSGHPLLRSAAVTAAKEAKFSPTFLSGKVVKVTGVLTYNFALPKKEDQ